MIKLRFVIAAVLIIITLSLVVLNQWSDRSHITENSTIMHQKPLEVKYFRCPGFHPSFRMDGLNVLKRKLLGFLGEIQCVEKDRVILMPPLLNHGDILDKTDGKQYLIPFGNYMPLIIDSVFDLEKLNEFMYPIRIEADAVDASNWSYKGLLEKDEVQHTFRDNRLGFAACKRRVKQLPQGIACTSEVEQLRDGYAIKSLISIVGLERTLDALQALRPAPQLRKITDQFLATKFPRGTESLMCIHLRTEFDFKDFFQHPPIYYSEEQYFRKIKWHMSKYPQLYKNISNIYIAGDHSEEYIESTVRPLFGQLFNGNILGHEAVKSFGNWSLENIQRSAIDQYICSTAKIFIGNSVSGFSEMTYLLRIAMHRGTNQEKNNDYMINNKKDTQDYVSDEPGSDASDIPNGFDALSYETLKIFD